MDLNKAEELALKHGFKPAPKDHPIYSEGVSITFVKNEKFLKRKTSTTVVTETEKTRKGNTRNG